MATQMMKPFIGDYEQEQESLLRKRKIAEALMAGGLAPLQMPSTPGAKLSPFEGIAQVLQAYMGAKQGKDLDAQEAGMRKQMQTDLQTQLPQFSEGMGARAGQEQQLPPDVQGPPAVWDEQTAQRTRREAVTNALASNHPMMKQLGTKFADTLVPERPKKLEPHQALAHMDADSVTRTLQNGVIPPDAKGKRNTKEVGGVVYDTDTGTIIQLKNGYKPEDIRMIKGADGQMEPYKINPSTGEPVKLDNAPKISASATAQGGTVIERGQKAGWEAAYKSASEHVEKLRTRSDASRAMMQSISELKNLDANGIFTNAPSSLQKFSVNLLQGLGVTPSAEQLRKLGNTETFDAVITDLWQNQVSKYGGNRGVTQQEAEEIKKMLPLAASSPQARQKIYAIMETAATRSIKQYHEAEKSRFDSLETQDIKKLRSVFENLGDPPPNTPNPATPATAGKPSTKPIPLDEYLRRGQ